MNEKRVLRCFWRGDKLQVETSAGSFELESGPGIKALKSNSVTLPASMGGDILTLYVSDEARRMSLIQERISGARD